MHGKSQMPLNIQELEILRPRPIKLLTGGSGTLGERYRLQTLKEVSNACPTQWHVAKHDVYGEEFLEAWEAAVGDEVNLEMLDIDTQMDDMVINDE